MKNELEKFRGNIPRLHPNPFNFRLYGNSQFLPVTFLLRSITSTNRPSAAHRDFTALNAAVSNLATTNISPSNDPLVLLIPVDVVVTSSKARCVCDNGHDDDFPIYVLLLIVKR